ncbi:MAG: DUF4271 domain-containing protein [Tannerella sp.]|jgi:hypothetical protein|nr:DUF4271 domain-containing protein [Tannerella sp.]
MNGADFDGYTGINLNETVFSSDFMLLVVFLMLSLFAIIFRLNHPLLGKMIGNINTGEERQSIFETTAKDSFFFNLFMTFQSLLLLSIIALSAAKDYLSLPKTGFPTEIIITLILFFAILIYFLSKYLLLISIGKIFADKPKFKMLMTNYQALFCTWGISLYIPALWILLIGRYIFIAYIILIISYLIFRAVLVFRIFHVFFNKNTGILFFSLYLCGQEIAPLVFLYEGLIYIFYIIEVNNIWQ